MRVVAAASLCIAAIMSPAGANNSLLALEINGITREVEAYRRGRHYWTKPIDVQPFLEGIREARQGPASAAPAPNSRLNGSDGMSGPRSGASISRRS